MLKIIDAYNILNRLLDQKGKELVNSPDLIKAFKDDKQFANLFCYVAAHELQNHDEDTINDDMGFAKFIIGHLESSHPEDMSDVSFWNHHYLALALAYQYYVFPKREDWIGYSSLNSDWKEKLSVSVQSLRKSLKYLSKCISDSNVIMDFNIHNETKRLYSCLLEYFVKELPPDIDSSYFYEDQLEEHGDIWIQFERQLLEWIEGQRG